MDSFINRLNTYFGQKAPALPEGAKKFIVSAAPWLAILSILFSLPSLFLLFGIGTLYAPFALMGGFRGTFYLTTIITLAGAIVTLLAIPGLFNKTSQGWKLVFYSSLLYLLSSLISQNIVGAVIGFIIDMYVLFQIKSYYQGNADSSNPTPLLNV